MTYKLLKSDQIPFNKSVFIYLNYYFSPFLYIFITIFSLISITDLLRAFLKDNGLSLLPRTIIKNVRVFQFLLKINCIKIQ